MSKKSLHDNSHLDLLQEEEQQGYQRKSKRKVIDIKNNHKSNPINNYKNQTPRDSSGFDLQRTSRQIGQLIINTISRLRLPRFNQLFALDLALFIVVGVIFSFNLAYINASETGGSFINQSFRSLAQASLSVVDTVWKPNLQSTDGYTGALIMGIDSRVVSFDGEEFSGSDRDVDSIIQVIFNHQTGEVFMFSIPRDTGIEVAESCAGYNRQYYKSINHLYRRSEDGNCELGGEGMMMKYVTDITGFENHYFALISYDAFKDIINALGEVQDGQRGLTIDVPRNIQEYYPREVGGGFEGVYFPQGEQFITTDRLLKYARSRKASSDFDRAARQQQVLAALQEQIVTGGELQNPAKLLEVYNSFRNNALYSELEIEDFTGIAELLDKFDPDKIYQFVLDDTLGGTNSLITKPSFSGGLHNRPGYYLSPIDWNDPECTELEDQYCKVKNHLAQVYLNPEIFAESPTIFVYSNNRGVSPETEEFTTIETKFPFPISVSRFAQPALLDRGIIQVYDFSGGRLPLTAKALERDFGVELIPGSEAQFQNINREDFAIVVDVTE